MTTINPNLVPQSFLQPDGATVKSDYKALAETVQAGVQAKLDKLPPIGDAVLLAQVANLAPGDVDTAEELSAVLDRFEAAAVAASQNGGAASASFTGDIAKFLARAMIEFAGQQREQAAEDRLAARAQAKAELLDQAGKMQAAASQLMSGALTNLIVGTIGSAVSIAGSAASIKGQVSQMGAMKTASQKSAQASDALSSLSEGAGQSKTLPKGPAVDVSVKVSVAGSSSAGGSGKSVPVAGAPVPDAAAPTTSASASKASLKADLKSAERDFDLASRQAGIEAAKGEAVGQFGAMLKSVGGSTDAALQAAAKKTEAEGQMDAAESQYQQQIADGKKDIQDAMKEMMSQIINFIKEMKEAEVDAMRALTRV